MATHQRSGDGVLKLPADAVMLATPAGYANSGNLRRWRRAAAANRTRLQIGSLPRPKRRVLLPVLLQEVLGVAVLLADIGPTKIKGG
jgi:hypothetical protein